jgi:hypothetical protein
MVLDIYKKIESSLIANDTEINRKHLAEKIIKEKIDLRRLLFILNSDINIATHFMWLVGRICELSPETVFPAINDFFLHRKTTQIKNYDRSLAKMFLYCGVPKEIEGEATTLMFEWILSPNVIVSTKNHSVKALYNLTLKYPELKSELILTIQEQLNKNSISFKQTASKVLKNLLK